MKVSWPLLFFILYASNLLGQFSIEEYLTSPFKEVELIGLAKQLESLESESFRSPLFRELEVRLRSNDFNLSPEDYRLRLGFINPFERKANKLYTELQTDYIENKYDYEVNLILANRYKQLISHFYLNQVLKLLNTEIKQLVISYEQIQGSNHSIKYLVETDEKLLKRELKRKEVLSSVDILENYLWKIHGIKDSIYWDNFTLVKVEKIKNQILTDTSTYSIAFELALKSFRLDEQSFKIEKAESFRNIGFIQAEYDTDRGKVFNDHMGFQLGINLPVFNVDKPKLQREKLELLETETQLKQEKNDSEIKRFNLNKKLLEHIWSYEIVEKRLKDFESFGSIVTYDRIEDFLAVINYLGNLQMMKNEIYFDCVNTYIDLIALSGQLSQKPFINYLSDN